MKNKILRKINFWDRCLIVLVIFLYWIFLRAILPNYPKVLKSAYKLCDHSKIEEITPSNRKDIRMFKCKTRIPIEVLFRAKTINVKISSTKKASMKVFLHRNHGSGGMHPESQRISPESKFGNIISYNLDHIDNPKINWLTGDYEEVLFDLNDFESLDNIKISIQDVYLQ